MKEYTDLYEKAERLLQELRDSEAELARERAAASKARVRHVTVEALARDLLAFVSFRYDDADEPDPDVEELLGRGNELFSEGGKA